MGEIIIRIPQRYRIEITFPSGKTEACTLPDNRIHIPTDPDVQSFIQETGLFFLVGGLIDDFYSARTQGSPLECALANAIRVNRPTKTYSFLTSEEKAGFVFSTTYALIEFLAREIGEYEVPYRP